MYETTDTLKHIHTQITQADINALTFSLTFLFSFTQTRTCTNFPSPPYLSDSPCRPSSTLLRCCQSSSPLPLLLKLTCYSQRFLRAFSSSSRPRQCPPRQTHRCRCFAAQRVASRPAVVCLMSEPCHPFSSSAPPRSRCDAHCLLHSHYQSLRLPHPHLLPAPHCC